MNISMKNPSGFPFSPAGMSKSAADRNQRRADMESQVDALKAGQASLKNRECDTLESIAQKLALYHSYESEIAAVKKAYNMQEMSHVMDEAAERGEKIAEAAKKNRPKTKEERQKEALAEATGTEQGLLAKLLEDNLRMKNEPESLEKLAEDFDFKENLEKLREHLKDVEASKLRYDSMTELADAGQALLERYRSEGGKGSFEDSVTLMAKAFSQVQERIDAEELTEEERALRKDELAQAFESYVDFLAVSRRIMTEIRQRFHGEFEGVDAKEVEENTRQAYHDAVSEENLERLREEKEHVSDYRLSFSVGRKWLSLLSQIRRESDR